MEYKNRLVEIVLIALCILFIILAWASFQHLKKMEETFNEEKAVLIKENMSLKDTLSNIETELSEKTSAIMFLERAKESLETEIKTVKEVNRKIQGKHAEELDFLREENALLSEKISELESGSLATQIEEAIAEEPNENIRRVLEEALYKINAIKSGNIIDLKPIVVTKKDSPDIIYEEAPSMPSVSGTTTGDVVSVNKKYNLIAFNLGRMDKVKEGDQCIVLKDDKEIASAEVISVRYKLSAALISDIKFRYSINDIREGDKILVLPANR